MSRKFYIAVTGEQSGQPAAKVRVPDDCLPFHISLPINLYGYEFFIHRPITGIKGYVFGDKRWAVSEVESGGLVGTFDTLASAISRLGLLVSKAKAEGKLDKAIVEAKKKAEEATTAHSPLRLPSAVKG